MNYHAHVYWQNEDQRMKALRARLPLAEMGCYIGTMWDQPIGPHPLPSYQANYNKTNAHDVESFLASTGLIVLLHEDTGDDIRDHTEGARWLNQELKLDLDWLNDYQKNKQDVLLVA